MNLCSSAIKGSVEGMRPVEVRRRWLRGSSGRKVPVNPGGLTLDLMHALPFHPMLEKTSRRRRDQPIKLPFLFESSPDLNTTGWNDAPTLALYHHSPPSTPRRRPVSRSPQVFIHRSIQNLKQGNIALFVVFCGCLWVFLRALVGAGYDEGLSADADARIAKHPSLLSRWGPESQHMLEEQWAKLRRSSDGSGLWKKIKRDDVRAAQTLTADRPSSDPLQIAEFHIQPPPGETIEPSHIPAPEHDISEDLDAHDMPDASSTEDLPLTSDRSSEPTLMSATADEEDEDGLS